MCTECAVMGIQSDLAGHVWIAIWSQSLTSPVSVRSVQLGLENLPTSPKCHAATPSHCSWLRYFESETETLIAQQCQNCFLMCGCVWSLNDGSVQKTKAKMSVVTVVKNLDSIGFESALVESESRPSQTWDRDHNFPRPSPDRQRPQSECGHESKLKAQWYIEH